MELTKEYFDKALGGISSDVSAIKSGIVNLATQESLNELIKTVTEVQKTVNVHTTALCRITKNII